MTNESHPTAALEAAARRRRELRDALVAFEEALSSPLRDRETWRRAVSVELEHLAQSFDDHVRETERAGGLYEEMEEEAPHLGGKARRLRDEHPRVAAAIDEARRVLGAAPLAAETDAEALREELQQLMGRIVRHRRGGADLVWEAYAIDIGTAG